MLHTRGQPVFTGGAAARAAAAEEMRLIGLVQQGDLRAFEALYRLYHPRLTRFLYAMLRRPHLIEEVLNDAMMVVWRRPEAFDGTSKVSTWVFAIAYRTALKARSRYDEPREDLNAAARPSEEAGPEDQLGRAQARDRLLQAMDGLSGDHRAVLDLTYFHGMECREVAEVMGCPVGTVKTRMHHARLRLRQALAGGLEDWL